MIGAPFHYQSSSLTKSPSPSMTMTSNNPSINISVATKYLDPGERGAQVTSMVILIHPDLFDCH